MRKINNKVQLSECPEGRTLRLGDLQVLWSNGCLMNPSGKPLPDLTRKELFEPQAWEIYVNKEWMPVANLQNLDNLEKLYTRVAKLEEEIERLRKELWVRSGAIMDHTHDL